MGKSDFDDTYFYYVNWPEKESSFKRSVWFDSLGSKRIPNNGICFKIQLNDGMKDADFELHPGTLENTSLEDDPDIKEILMFLRTRARRLIYLHWNKKIDDLDLLLSLRRVRAGVPEDIVINDILND